MATAEPAHGLAVLGTLKYPKDFAHFDYVYPNAPRGGRVRLWYQGSFNTVNPFTLKGQWAAGSNPFGTDGKLLTFQTLMEPSRDEPDSYYGLIAESVELPDDSRSITFNLNGKARFHDGSAITAEDVAYSFDTLKADGHPAFRVLYKDIVAARVLAPLRVRFDFRDGVNSRDLPSIIATLPVLSKAYYSSHAFDETTLTAPLGSGPYQVETVDEGRAISYVRLPNWADDLGVYKGRWNIERVTWDYYLDRDIALEALFAGKLDFREDYTSRNWATKYDNVPAVLDGRLKRETLPDGSPSGLQGFFINTRRGKFADRRVREALSLAFDFEWTNKTLFYGAYKRTHSIFQNSDLEAEGAPSAEELALLEPWRGQVPEEVFGTAYRPPVTDGSGNLRRQLRQAAGLLKAAGWTIVDGRRVNAAGEAFTIEFLSYSNLFERIVAPYIQNLDKLGIVAKFRLVDPANYQNRVQLYDFDMTTFRFTMALTPGVGLTNYFGSAAADIDGSRNYARIKSPAVDNLIDRIIAANSRTELRTAAKALDRVLTWNHYIVPQWFKAAHNVAYWDMFGRPAVKPLYDLGMLDTWWIDADKARELGR